MTPSNEALFVEDLCNYPAWKSLFWYS